MTHFTLKVKYSNWTRGGCKVCGVVGSSYRPDVVIRSTKILNFIQMNRTFQINSVAGAFSRNNNLLSKCCDVFWFFFNFLFLIFFFFVFICNFFCFLIFFFFNFFFVIFFFFFVIFFILFFFNF